MFPDLLLLCTAAPRYTKLQQTTPQHTKLLRAALFYATPEGGGRGVAGGRNAGSVRAIVDQCGVGYCAVLRRSHT